MQREFVETWRVMRDKKLAVAQAEDRVKRAYERASKAEEMADRAIIASRADDGRPSRGKLKRMAKAQARFVEMRAEIADPTGARERADRHMAFRKAQDARLDRPTISYHAPNPVVELGISPKPEPTRYDVPADVLAVRKEQAERERLAKIKVLRERLAELEGE